LVGEVAGPRLAQKGEVVASVTKFSMRCKVSIPCLVLKIVTDLLNRNLKTILFFAAAIHDQPLLTAFE